jgi:ABC-type multidrug transport system fused ATPase/permease subunit
LNRFTFDIDIIDKRIPLLIGYVLLLMFLVIVDIAAILIGAQDFWLIIPCIIFLVVGHLTRKRYMKAKREMMRLYSISKSPISGLAEAIIKGSPLIRALNREEYFSKKMLHYIEENNKSGYVGYGLDQWF